MNLSDDQILEIIKLHQQTYDQDEFVTKVTEKFSEISLEFAATLDKVISATLDQLLIEMVEQLAEINVNDL